MRSPREALIGVHVAWHPSSVEHDPGPGHPESPARVEAILGTLREAEPELGLTFVETPPATDAQLLRVHAPEFLSRLEAISAAGGGVVDADTRMSASSYDAARHAAGAAVYAAHSAIDGNPAFAVVRPPGHHATRDRAMGFCLINNIAVAAHGVLEEPGLERVLIVDWDVHHGNGTQAIVEADARIRYVSMHQWPSYPGTGGADERGVGNLFNVPLRAGLSRVRYVEALNDAVDRATEGWEPDVLLVSAGYDAMAGDPLAGFTLEPDDYRGWIERWQSLDLPMALVLEGGYVPIRIAEAALVSVRALARAC